MTLPSYYTTCFPIYDISRIISNVFDKSYIQFTLFKTSQFWDIWHGITSFSSRPLPVSVVTMYVTCSIIGFIGGHYPNMSLAHCPHFHSSMLCCNHNRLQWGADNDMMPCLAIIYHINIHTLVNFYHFGVWKLETSVTYKYSSYVWTISTPVDPCWCPNLCYFAIFSRQ